MKVSRRQLIQIGSAIAYARAIRAQSPGRNAAEAGLTSLNPDPNRRILFQGGTIISMDPAVGDFVQGGILVQGNKIAALGVNVKAPGPAPRVIDASNTILIPGFVDCHRHSWEGVLRRIIPNGDIAKYTATTHQGFAPYYRPHDMYVGNLITALGCISGIRAVHASGAPQKEPWDHQWPQDLQRLQKRFFASDDQLVTLRMFSGLDRENYRARPAHHHGIPRSRGGGDTGAVLGRKAPRSRYYVQSLRRLNGSGVAENSRIGRNRRCVPEIRSAICLGDGIPAFQKARDHGIRPGLRVDNEVSYGTDMFTEMRVVFNIQRAFATNRKVNGDANPPTPVNVREVLECATVNGAACAGLSAKCGTLSPGKEAFFVLWADERDTKHFSK